MSRESKIIYSTNANPEDVIYEYESFGWELLAINGDQVSLTRETQNPVYTDLVKYQAKYERLRAELDALPPHKKYTSPSCLTCAVLFVLAVFPLILYAVYKINESKKIKEENAELDRKRAELLSQIREVCETSRATFFGKQK